DLDLDARIDEIDLHDARRGPDVAEEVAVDHGDALDRGDVRDVDPGHDRVLEPAAEVLDSGLHDLEGPPHLIGDPALDRIAVLIEAGGAGDADDAAVPDRSRVAELELVLRLRAVQPAIRVPGVAVRHARPPAGRSRRPRIPSSPRPWGRRGPA